MQQFSSYCSWIRSLPQDAEELHREYHDLEYGFPLHSDVELFGRLILEINQAGLSWTTILKKRHNFSVAYDGFDVDRIASYDDTDVQRLLTDAGIIRNRLKVQAAISNAKVIQNLREEHGSFRKWLDHHHPRSRDEWTRLFRSTFRFTGGEIVNEFLLSTGYLPGAHEEACPIFSTIARLTPPWMREEKGK